MHHGQNRGKQESKLSKTNVNFAEIGWKCINFAEIGEFVIFLEIGGLGGMYIIGLGGWTDWTPLCNIISVFMIL